jgi:hypothetical protein
MGANIKLAMTGNSRRQMTTEIVQDVIDGEVPVDGIREEIDKRVDEKSGGLDDTANSIRSATKTVVSRTTESIDSFFGNSGKGIEKAVEWIGKNQKVADKVVDSTVGVLIEKVEKAKRDVEDKIESVRNTFDKLTKDFDDAFGFINGKHYVEDAFRNASNTAYEIGTPGYDALGELTGEVADFVKNFNIGKVVTAMGGIVVGAGAATLAIDLLPSIDVDRMMRNVMGGIDTYRRDKMEELYYNKYNEDAPELVEVPDLPWQLSKDDLERYNADGYNKYLEDFAEENDKVRSEILEKMCNAKTFADIRAVSKENRELMKENKSAIKAMRKVRRDAIKARSIERYKQFLSIELNYLKRDCLNLKNNIKYEWDTMMKQYKDAIEEIKTFFTVEGSGGCEAIDRCCDRINMDATQIVEMCTSITTELVNASAMVPTPYAIGICVDMPVHKILAFVKDIQIIVTFLKNLIRLGIDIISQLTIIAKIIFCGLQDLSTLLDTLKKLIGVDAILNMIDFIVGLFRPKMADSKILLENALSPIYYNETEEYEEKINALEALLSDSKDGGFVEEFRYTDDVNARSKYRNKIYGGELATDEDIENALEELESKGEREIVAYRSPIMNDSGDDFAGWIFYYPDAYDDMKKTWSSKKKRKRNRVIKKASKKNKMKAGRLIGGVAQLKSNRSFGYYNENNNYISNSVTAFQAYYWYTKWTNDPTDCDPDFDNIEYVYDDDGNIISASAKKSNVVAPIQTTSNGSLVELSDGRRVFVEGKNVKSGDYENVDGKKYRVK